MSAYVFSSSTAPHVLMLALAFLFVGCGESQKSSDWRDDQPSLVEGILKGRVSDKDIQAQVDAAPTAEARQSILNQAAAAKQASFSSNDAQWLKDNFFNDPAFTSVTDAFGYTKINMKQLKEKGIIRLGARYTGDEKQAMVYVDMPWHHGLSDKAPDNNSPRPWSGYYFPLRAGLMHRSTDSVLRKLDRVESFEKGLISQVADKEAQMTGGADDSKRSFLPNWEGYCQPWAMASILFPEPVSTVSRWDGRNWTYFSPGESKALLMMTMTGAMNAINDGAIKRWGQEFISTSSDSSNPWLYDMLPHQVLRLIEKFIFEARVPVIMDHDKGDAQWTVPVFGAAVTLRPNPDSPYEVFMRMNLLSAEPYNSLDDDEIQKSFNTIGTKIGDRDYEAVLIGEKVEDDGSMEIKRSLWRKLKSPDGILPGIDSIEDHPDFFITIDASKIRQQSLNPLLDLASVNQIVKDSVTRDQQEMIDRFR